VVLVVKPTGEKTDGAGMRSASACTGIWCCISVRNAEAELSIPHSFIEQCRNGYRLVAHSGGDTAALRRRSPRRHKLKEIQYVFVGGQLSFRTNDLHTTAKTAALPAALIIPDVGTSITPGAAAASLEPTNRYRSRLGADGALQAPARSATC